MSILEIHNNIGNRFWLEQTSENVQNQKIYWVFHQPANGIKGTYAKYLNKKRQIGDGVYDLEVDKDKVLILIDGDSDFYLVSFNFRDTMIWHSKTKNSSRTFKDNETST